MKVVALAGGVGAARFLSGLVEVVAAEEVTVVVNTGDDFEWLGLYVSPDVDTIVYTLAGLANPETGWGIRGDTFHALERLAELGCEPWFRIGDRDLATHVYRTQALRSGRSLTEVTRALARQKGVGASILPMTDSRVPTLVHTDEGTLELQDYFVRRRAAPRVTGFTFCGADAARPAPGVLDAIASAALVVVCPSNPFISIGPILALPGIRRALTDCGAPVVAIAPIIAGRAVKGPTAAMLDALCGDTSAVAVARLYRELADVFVLDREDRDLAPAVETLGVRPHVADTRLDGSEARRLLAHSIVELAR